METKTLTKRFTVIELLVVVAILGILSSILVPALQTARTKTLQIKWCEQNSIPPSQVSLSDFKQAFIKIDENGKILVSEALLPLAKENIKHEEEVKSPVAKPDAPKLTTYELWCKHTGNPKKFSVQEFKTLLAEGLVKECSFETYKYCTGNPRSLTKEEFEVLVKADAFDFSGVWDVQKY